MRQFITFITAGLIMGVLFSSCSKSLEDRITGFWKLEEATRRVSSGTSVFRTGYEEGIFHLDENGLATYIEGSDTLSGYWRAGKHTKGIYNNSEGTWQARDMRFLLINVSNTFLHRTLEWRFDDIDFHSNNRGLRAEQYTLGFDRIYEFKKR
jgi:hypothetical protein